MQNFPISDLVKEISSVLGLINSLGVFAIALWIAYRTKSGFLIRRRLWRILFGENSEGIDPEIKKFSAEQDSLMQFVYDSGLSRVRTLFQAKKVLKLMRDKDVPPLFLSKVGHHFDFETQTLKPISERRRRFGIFLFAGFLVPLIWMMLFLLTLSILPRAMLSVKDSGNYYVVDTKVAKSAAWGASEKRPTITVEMCQKPVSEIVSELAIPSGDVTVLCELMQHPDAPSYIAESLQSQRWACWIALVLLSLLVWQLIVALVELDYYQRLKKCLLAGEKRAELKLNE